MSLDIPEKKALGDRIHSFRCHARGQASGAAGGLGEEARRFGQHGHGKETEETEGLHRDNFTNHSGSYLPILRQKAAKKNGSITRIAHGWWSVMSCLDWAGEHRWTLEMLWLNDMPNVILCNCPSSLLAPLPHTPAEPLPWPAADQADHSSCAPSIWEW